MPPKKATDTTPKKALPKGSGKDEESPTQMTPSKGQPLTQEQALDTQLEYQNYYDTYCQLDKLVRGPNPKNDGNVTLGKILDTWKYAEHVVVLFDQITI